MDARTRVEPAKALRRQRAAVLARFSGAEADLRSIAEERESELEEEAQEEQSTRILARLDDRSMQEVQEIHAALGRMIDRTYGGCVECGRPSPVARLRALPDTARCFECAREAETAPAPEGAPEPRHPGRLALDLDRLADRGVEETLRELVRQDGRLDREELRIVCRHGIVCLEGAVPSEAERSMLLKLLTDVAGCEGVVDRLQANEILWERADRSRSTTRDERRPRRRDSMGTEDVRGGAPLRDRLVLPPPSPSPLRREPHGMTGRRSDTWTSRFRPSTWRCSRPGARSSTSAWRGSPSGIRA